MATTVRLRTLSGSISSGNFLYVPMNVFTPTGSGSSTTAFSWSFDGRSGAVPAASHVTTRFYTDTSVTSSYSVDSETTYDDVPYSFLCVAAWRSDNPSSAVTNGGSSGNFTFEASDDYYLIVGIYERKSVKVTFDASPGSLRSGTENPQTKYVGDAYGELPVPTLEVHDYNQGADISVPFTGWFTSSTGGSEVSSDTIVSNQSDHTLYARYEAGSSEIVVTFDPAGGSVSQQTKTLEIKTSEATYYGALPAPTRSGYTFVRWKAPDGSTVTADSLVADLSDHTLTAEWYSNATKWKLVYDTKSGRLIYGDLRPVGA